eukprot:CAMPEP_0113447170 /NCGR_PEP_ID=MMETSP0014_2-20120614/4097_1 /TAXON_ID=2857 /ORGANISM="Nitzschia sp." /LENGTH=554 /DNA_ID=CAMNT_0000338311 /DNA_START=148 /DNA_END=1812 /DNA_ORIENTATION=+ /assembly_acc=CAM_ASM_000159
MDGSGSDDDDADADDDDDYHDIATTARTKVLTTRTRTRTTATSSHDKRIRKFTKTKKMQTKKKNRRKKDLKNPTNIIFNDLTSSSSLMKKIGLGFVLLVFVANFIILSVYLPSASDSAKLRISISSRSTSGVSVPISSANKKKKKKKKNVPPCGDDNGVQSSSSPWGCTIFPPEYTFDYNLTMRSKSDAKSKLSLRESSASSTSSGDYTFASLTEQGKSHAVNQDRGFVVTQFMDEANDDDNTNAIHPNNFLMGVFDGHGEYGHNVSQRCVETFPKLLYGKLLLVDQDDSPTVEKMLNETFWELDRQGTSPEYYMGGTTATVALRLGEDKLYVANTGDSQTIVVQCTKLGAGRAGGAGNDRSNNSNNVKAEVIFKSIKDKPTLLEEHDRILRRGGVIGPNGGRVIVHTKAVRKDIIGLAMSRSIGDWEWGDVGVIPEPRVDVIDLKPYYHHLKSTSNKSKSKDDTTTSTTTTSLFVMSASDGIWDRRLRPDFFARQFCSTFLGGGDEMMKSIDGTTTNVKNNVLQRKLMDVIDLVTPTVGYQDDMTAVIMKLDL